MTVQIFWVFAYSREKIGHLTMSPIFWYFSVYDKNIELMKWKRQETGDNITWTVKQKHPEVEPSSSIRAKMQILSVRWGWKHNLQALTRSRAPGTIGNPDQKRGTSSVGIPHTSPSGPHHPRCRPPAAGPASRHTRGSWAGLGSLWFQCGGTGAGSRGRIGGCSPAARGAGQQADAPGTGDTPGDWSPRRKRLHPETAGWRRVALRGCRRLHPGGSWRLWPWWLWWG